MHRSLILCGSLLVATTNLGLAAVIGTNPPSQPLTVERIAGLPAAEQTMWREYLERSNRQRQADQAFLRAEMQQHGVREALVPPAARNVPGLGLTRPAAWYGQEEAARLAEIVRSFQTPAGGWSKNLDLTKHVRRPGEHFAEGSLSHFLAPADHDQPADKNWSYVGTFDNYATTTQVRFLAKVAVAQGPERGTVNRAAVQRGLEYIFAAQNPNGGWPQVWPLQGGYHDAITYNDGAMVHVLELLRDVTDERSDFAFLAPEVRIQAARRLALGIACILRTQIVVAGKRTVWCQQHDALTLQPTSARNYEMPSQCSAESAGLMLFLMRLPQPHPEMIAAVHAAAAWFEQTAIRGKAYRTVGGNGRQLVDDPRHGPLWPRYVEIGTDRPLFGDRDKTIHDEVGEISAERRNGYQWYVDSPAQALAVYARWRQKFPAKE